MTFAISDYEVTAPGGPILVVTSAANPFTSVLREILRTEGLNAFGLLDISQVDSTTLGRYRRRDSRGDGAHRSAGHMFTDWVTAGGNLIAMRPDKKLASCSDWPPAPTLADAYLKVDTSAPPGAGIVGQTMQFQGPPIDTRLLGRRPSRRCIDANTATDESCGHGP